MMLVNGCNANSPNDQYETPFFLLLKNSIVKNDLIKFVCANIRIDYYSYNSNKMVRIMEERGLQSLLSKKTEFIVDLDYMTQHIGEWNQVKFANNLEILKKNSKDFRSDLTQLLEEAIVKNLPVTVGTLMSYGVDTNEIPKNTKFKMTPAFLACTMGYHQVLKILLNDRNLSFQCNESQGNLLHQMFYSESVDEGDRKKLFDLVIADKRCTLNIINETDDEDHVPVYYACQYGCDEITKELIRRGAYVGYGSVLGSIKKDILEEILDECVTCSSDINDRNCEIYIDYQFLMPPNRAKLEITTAHLMAANSNTQDLVLHPVISTFVLLKWKKIDFIVYFNLLVYFGFMLFLGFIIINFYNVSKDFEYDQQYCEVATLYHDEVFDVKLSEYSFKTRRPHLDNSDESIAHLLFENLNAILRLYNKSSDSAFDFGVRFSQWENVQDDEEWNARFRQHFAERSISYWCAIFGLVLMSVYEIVHCVISWRDYLFEPTNWLDISLIGFSFFVLVKNVDVGRDSFTQICAIMILLMGAQSIQLFSKVSAFSLSLHMAIMNKVWMKILKTIAPYLLVISAFGMSFFALNIDDYNESIMSSVIDSDSAENVDEDEGFSNPFLSTISTVRMMLSDFDAVNIRKGDHFQGLLFLAFMISISIVLFNLLNALAINEINKMMESAEFVEISKRISTLRYYESLFDFFNLVYSNVFPKLTTILLTPYKHRVIKIKRKIAMSNNVTILMQKTGKITKFEYLYADWKWWKNQPEPVSFDEKSIKKILDYLRNQQEKHSTHMEKYRMNQEMYALRVAQNDIYKELQQLKSFQEALQTTVNENFQDLSNMLKFMQDSTIYVNRSGRRRRRREMYRKRAQGLKDTGNIEKIENKWSCECS